MIKLKRFTKSNWMCYQGAEGLPQVPTAEPLIGMLAINKEKLENEVDVAEIIISLQGIEIYTITGNIPIMYRLKNPESSALVLQYIAEKTTDSELKKLGFESEPC